MKPEFKKLLEKSLDTKKLIIILIIGIALLFLPGIFSQSVKQEEPKEGQPALMNQASYEKELEGRLTKILNTVQGVSQVSVMITLSDSGETYYAQNQQTDLKTTDNAGITEKNNQSQGALALKNNPGGGQSPVLLKVNTPRISGVLVTAKGVSNPTVQSNVINAVRAVLNVSAHRVQVLEKA